MKQETIKRIKNAATVVLGVAVYWVLITAIYLTCSFLSEAWNITWIIFPCAAFLFAVIALVFFNIKAGKKFSILNLIAITVFVCTAIYLLVSFLTHLWAFTWLIFIVMTVAILIELMFFLQKKPKIETPENE